LMYNPTLIEAKRIGTLCSQIDYPPTLLNLMNWSYRSRFFGKDILKMHPEEERAFIASYQKLGLMNRKKLAVLKPVRKRNVYTYEQATGDLTEIADDALAQDGIAYYQTASYIFAHGLHGAIDDL
jgi:phosphoglycerol transferase MdoB-like AlkP superfamily enzyme